MGLSESYLELHEAKDSTLDTVKGSAILTSFVSDEIGNMKYEIEQSEAGSRKGVTILNKENGDGYTKNINTSTKSTFPLYLQDIFNGSGTKKRFLSAGKKGSGKVYDRIMLHAIDRLIGGYQNEHGYDEPSKDFNDELKAPTPF